MKLEAALEAAIEEEPEDLRGLLRLYFEIIQNKSKPSRVRVIEGL